MSAQPTIAHATPAPAEMSGSGGWVGVISAILVALGRRPSANGSSRSASDLSLMERLRSAVGQPERREDRSSAAPAQPAITSDVADAPIAPVRTVAGVGPVRDIALSPDGRYAYVAASLLDRSSGADTWAV
jgi:hypothetical protein